MFGAQRKQTIVGFYGYLTELDMALRAQIEPNHFLKAPRRGAFKK